MRGHEPKKMMKPVRDFAEVESSGGSILNKPAKFASTQHLKVSTVEDGFDVGRNFDDADYLMANTDKWNGNTEYSTQCGIFSFKC